MSELYCTTCSQFFDTIGMKQITEWSGRNRSTALFLDKRNGTCHEFLSEKHSNAKRKPKVEPATTINVPSISAKAGEVPVAQLSNQEVVFVSEEVMRPPQHPTTCEVGDMLHVCISLNKKERARATWWANDAWKEERSAEDEVVRF